MDTGVIILETQRRQYEGHNTPLDFYTDQGPGVYCGLSTASDVFLIFTNHVHSCLCKYDAIVFIS